MLYIVLLCFLIMLVLIFLMIFNVYSIPLSILFYGSYSYSTCSGYNTCLYISLVFSIPLSILSYPIRRERKEGNHRYLPAFGKGRCANGGKILYFGYRRVAGLYGQREREADGRLSWQKIIGSQHIRRPERWWCLSDGGCLARLYAK